MIQKQSSSHHLFNFGATTDQVLGSSSLVACHFSLVPLKQTIIQLLNVYNEQAVLQKESYTSFS